MLSIYRRQLKKYPLRFDFLLSHYKAGNILDIGNIGGIEEDQSVNNSFSKEFAQVANGTVYGFDLFELPDAAIENQKYGDIEDGLPYEDDFFDTVYMGELIEHLTDFKTALREVRRVLKPDGVFILDTPNAYSFNKLIRWIVGWEKNGNDTHTVLFSPAGLHLMLSHAGFDVEIATDGRNGLGDHLLAVCKSTPQKYKDT